MVFMARNSSDRAGRRPDFVAREGVVVWTNQTKDGKPYLSISIPLLNIKVNAFKLESEEHEVPVQS